MRTAGSENAWSCGRKVQLSSLEYFLNEQGSLLRDISLLVVEVLPRRIKHVPNARRHDPQYESEELTESRMRLSKLSEHVVEYTPNPDRQHLGDAKAGCGP